MRWIRRALKRSSPRLRASKRMPTPRSVFSIDMREAPKSPFFGDDGRDTFLNADGYAETVDCGAGTGDDPQPSSLDTFISCEAI